MRSELKLVAKSRIGEVAYFMSPMSESESNTFYFVTPLS